MKCMLTTGVVQSVNSDTCTSESGEDHPKEDSRASSLITWIIGFIIIFQARHVISDSAIEALLKFLCILMKILGQFSEFLQDMAGRIPSSVYMLFKTVKNRINFTKFVVCPSRDRLYRFDKCITTNGSQKSSKKCNYFIQYPDHPYAHFRRPCNHLLLKNILPSGNQP